MASYAPIFANLNNRMWAPDMIQYTSDKVFGTPSYYVQNVMANNIDIRGQWKTEGSLIKQTSNEESCIRLNPGEITSNGYIYKVRAKKDALSSLTTWIRTTTAG